MSVSFLLPTQKLTDSDTANSLSNYAGQRFLTVSRTIYSIQVRDTMSPSEEWAMSHVQLNNLDCREPNTCAWCQCSTCSYFSHLHLSTVSNYFVEFPKYKASCCSLDRMPHIVTEQQMCTFYLGSRNYPVRLPSSSVLPLYQTHMWLATSKQTKLYKEPATHSDEDT